MKARDNPFAPSRLERLLAFDPELIGSSWKDLETRWQALGRRAAVTGHHGAGKTTLLAAWGRRLEDRGEKVIRLFFNEEHRHLTDADRALLRGCTGKHVMLDGESHLVWRDRREARAMLGRAEGVLVARHRRGPWPELIRLKSDPGLAAVLLERVSPGYLSPALLERELRRCRGNLRELWLACYDRNAAK